MKTGMIVTILSLLAFGAVAAGNPAPAKAVDAKKEAAAKEAAAKKAAAEKAAAEKKAAAAKKKASEDAWNALKKKGDGLGWKNWQGGYASYWHDGIDAARTNYEAALSNPVFLNAQKLQIYCAIANCRLEATRDEDGAVRDLEAAKRLPGLTDDERKKAEANLQNLLVRIGRVQKPAPKPKEAADYVRIVENAKDERELYWDHNVRHYFGVLFESSFDEMAKALPEKFRKLQERFPKNNFYTPLFDELVEPCHGDWRSPVVCLAKYDKRFVRFVFDFVKKAPEGQRPAPERLFDYAVKQRALEADAVALAPEVLKRAENPKNHVWWELVEKARKLLAFKDVRHDAGRLIAACRDYMKARGKENDKKGLVELLGEQARASLAAGDEKTARAVWAERERLAPPLEQAVMDCPWWGDAPHDPRGIVESDFYKKAKKSLLTRPYGDNLQFLIETDSALRGRKMTTDNGKQFRPTELFAFCDSEGVKIMLRAFDDNMADIKAGRAGASGYETYLTTGIDDAYRCYMIDPREGGGGLNESFVTQYDNITGYRTIQKKRGNLRYDCLYLDDSVVVLLAIPWTSTFAAIPSKSPEWYFEALHWAHGGRSWGGSQSVHGRSSFGALRFTGVGAKELTAIKRRLLATARGVWSFEQAGSANGYIEIWSDPELGDQEFYLAEVEPLVRKVNADSKRIKADMTDAEVNEIYDRWGETMFNVRFVIAEMRRAWLERKMTTAK